MPNQLDKQLKQSNGGFIGMNIKNVTIAGTGTLGSQIAWQTAFHGFNVTVYDKYEKGIEAGKKFHKKFAELFKSIRGSTQDEIDQTFANLTYTTNLGEAVKDADLISESVPESLELKKEFYQELASVAPDKTIFTTNSSTLMPSQLAKETGRPEKFLALHFANGIWDANIAEIMGHPGTAPEIFDSVVKFSRDIGMVPIPIQKEHSGYVLNSLLIPWLSAAGDLLVNGVSDYESIDKTWMISTGMKQGPFAIMDKIGLQTVYNISKILGEKSKDNATLARAEYYKNNFIDKGKLGVSSGEGFYQYPNPKYQNADFLK